MKKYANGGASGVPRPPKGEKYAAEANDWRAGEDEFAMAKEKAKKAKPPAPKPKAYARGGGIETKGKTKGRFV